MYSISIYTYSTQFCTLNGLGSSPSCSSSIAELQQIFVIVFVVVLDIYSCFILRYFSVSCMKTNFLVSQFSKKLIVKNLSFFLLEGSITMGIIRATIAFLITLKRFIATFFPTFFHNNWRKIPLYWIIIPILCHLLFDQCIIFGFCGNVIDVPVDCDNFQCTFNECYQKYWEFHEQVVFSLIETLSLLLFIRLYIWKRSSHLLHKVGYWEFYFHLHLLKSIANFFQKLYMSPVGRRTPRI